MFSWASIKIELASTFSLLVLVVTWLNYPNHVILLVQFVTLTRQCILNAHAVVLACEELTCGGLYCFLLVLYLLVNYLK
jgi:hypothetical protein